MKKYCYLEPDFPKQAFSTIVVLQNESSEIPDFEVLPLFPIFENLHDVRDVIESISAEFVKEREKEIEDKVILLPLVFEKPFLLKKEYWEDKPAFSYGNSERSKLFYQLEQNPLFYNLLVLPSNYDSKSDKWDFVSVLPFTKNTENEIVDSFMKGSDWPVDIRAKFAGIYRVESSLVFDWKTGEILRPKVFSSH